MLENLNDKELSDFIQELETKYQKLLKLAKKLGQEMDELHEQYIEAQKELNKRKGLSNGK